MGRKAKAFFGACDGAFAGWLGCSFWLLDVLVGGLYFSRMKKQGAIKKIFLKQRLENESEAQAGAFDFVLVLDGLKPDFNVGKIFRTADALGCREVHLVNVPFFNPVTARGSFKHVPAKFHNTFSSVYGKLSEQGYTFFTLEPDQHQTLFNVEFPRKAAFVFGHEEFGLSFKKDDYLNVEGLSIPQFGKVQSLNVSVAAAIVMSEYVRQHHRSDSMATRKAEGATVAP